MSHLPLSMTAGLEVGTATPTRRVRIRTKARSDAYGAAITKSSGSPSAATSSAPGKNYGRFVLKECNPEYVVVQGAIDADLLSRVHEFLKKKRPRAARMKNEGGNSDDERKARYNDRDSRVSWFFAEAECPELHDRLAEVTRDVGNVEWPLLRVKEDGELDCEYEQTQYAVYGESQHFKAWHQDAFAEGNDPEDARQITVVAMLSRKNDFTGGKFQAKLRDKDGKQKILKSIPLEAGDCLLFPAKKLLHRVCPVNTGIRKTLVFWAFDRQSSNYHRAKMEAGEEVRPGQNIRD